MVDTVTGYVIERWDNEEGCYYYWGYMDDCGTWLAKPHAIEYDTRQDADSALILEAKAPVNAYVVRQIKEKG